MTDPTEASRQALASIDDLHAADPALLNRETRRLWRTVKVRKALYYSVLWPFGAIARFIAPLGVLVTAVVALPVLIWALLSGASAAVTVIAGYWALGAAAYHGLALAMANALDRAAASVGLRGDDVLAEWARRSREDRGP